MPALKQFARRHFQSESPFHPGEYHIDSSKVFIWVVGAPFLAYLAYLTVRLIIALAYLFVRLIIAFFSLF